MPDVKLRRIVTTPEKLREEIRSYVKDAVIAKFPIEGNKYVATVENLQYKEVEFPHQKQRDILKLRGKVDWEGDLAEMRRGRCFE